MKKTLLAIVLLVLSVRAFSQKAGCIASTYYTLETPSGEKRINSLASVCYTGTDFAFYTKATGNRSFRVTEATTKMGSNGNMVENFLNDEDQTNARGDIMVEIEYGKITTVMISFTRFGQAYIIRGKGTIGHIGAATAAMQNVLKGKPKGKIIIPNYADGKIRCASVPYYTFMRNGAVSRSMAPAAACYDGKTFCFTGYNLERGGVFSIADRTVEKDRDGTVEESFVNKSHYKDEMDGTYFQVKITYSYNTVISIENVQARWTCVITTNNFSTAPPTDSTGQKAYRGMSDVWKHPFVEPVPPFDVSEWLIKKVDMPELEHKRVYFEAFLTITDSGTVKDVKWYNAQIENGYDKAPGEEFKRRATPLLLNMPKWKPAISTADKPIEYSLNSVKGTNAPEIPEEYTIKTTPVPPFDVVKWLFENSDLPGVKKSEGSICFSVTITNDGTVKFVEWSMAHLTRVEEQTFEEHATAMLYNMPKWQPAIDNTGKPVAWVVQFDRNIKAEPKKGILPTLKKIGSTTGILNIP